MQSALAGLSLLVLGDSHWAANGYLVTTLQDQLIQRGATVNSFAACGAPPSAWLSARVASCGTAQRLQRGALQNKTGSDARTTPLDDLVRQYRPNMIAISMGDTIAGYVQRQTPADTIREEAMALTDRIKRLGIPCIWIGPAWGTEGGPFLKSFARVQEVSAILARSVSPCAYVDSTKLSRPGEWPTFDGQHFTLDGYRAYGTALAQTIAQMPEVRAAAQKR
ncbi:Lysophospholipase L1 [Roseomonas rosea]|uniref:Lysophospholipase L1 n=1 Tax=Muricoccus roseus TaxID=198092 RepID=A0A1M6EYC3_9PROT|nr:SGNH/GDSL hydrolase family protein [Roseomonas rosea]SHI90379.1 Lysophospholipase L1 [Roseomonas rosea]